MQGFVVHVQCSSLLQKKKELKGQERGSISINPENLSEESMLFVTDLE